MPNVSIPIAVQQKDLVLERLANGVLVKDIATELGVARETISRALSKDPDYQAAIAEALEARLEQRENELENARDGITLARSRELLAHARWRAERLNPQRWGQMKQAVQVNAGDGQVQVNIVSFSDENTSA